jgi:outer membrane lipoprotein-sorting protein
MFRRLAVVVGVLVCFAAVAGAQTADDIVGKTIAAQGLAKLKPVQSLRVTGTMIITPPNMAAVEGAIIIEVKRPAKTRMTLTIMGMENAQGYDGQNGWSLMPIQGKAAAEPATPDELKDLEEQADMDGTLVDYKTKGHKVELIGKDSVQGTGAYKLKVTLKNGDVQFQYIDTEHFLPIKMESSRVINGAETNTETFVGDYKDVNGVLMPHSIEARVMGVVQKVIVTKVEMNVPLDDARFKMPGK